MALDNAALKTLKWADTGDYRDPHSGGIFLNYSDPAMLARNDELMMNEGAQGTSALGTPDPNALANVRTNALAHRAENAAGQYEKDVKEGVGTAAGVAADESKVDLSRRLGVLGTTADVMKADANRPKWYNYVLQGAAGGLTAAAI